MTTRSPLDPGLACHLADELSFLEKATNYRDWLWELTAPYLGQRVLEVGAGLGYMTDCLGPRERIVALELVPAYVEALRQRFPESRVHVVPGDATDPMVYEQLGDGSFDSAMTFNVLEHIEDDVAVFRNVYRSLAPGGCFVCYVPAFPSIYGRMDTEVGHVRRYVKREIVERARSVGFAVPRVTYVNMPGYVAWYVNGKLLQSSGIRGGAAGVRLYDRMVVPVARLVERMVHPPFGQSLFLVAQRPR
jgi:SAM-dependent methyltransferase